MLFPELDTSPPPPPPGLLYRSFTVYDNSYAGLITKMEGKLSGGHGLRTTSQPHGTPEEPPLPARKHEKISEAGD